ncbi:MAG: TonB-dependent receptor, partial [Bacteroidetes bacterium]
MKHLFIILFLVIISPFTSFSQNTQNIRGNVIDEVTKLPLPGASVIIVGTNPIIGATTDEKGKFKIKNQKPGRYNLKVSYMGYQERYYANLEVFAGKELVITAELEEKIVEMKEVVISASIDKARPLNDLATVSARAFSVEETNRYAGSLGDPSRMAQNFAGVMSAGDSRNDIVIRGNSPMGLLWRMEGINIPNPNHFGASGTTGGPVTMLNNNLLSNSDFFTGAFPAEYGNALSGVFDLKMRSGNNENYEFVGQVGFNGFELGAEGPFSKKNNASFLVNYRYSTLAVFDAMGLNSIVGSSVPQYQDVNFKIDIPTQKSGRWTLFGIGGTSYIQIWDSEKKDDEASYGVAGTDTDFGSNMGVIGLSNVYYFNKKTRLKTNLSISRTVATTALDSLKGKDKIKSQFYRSSNQETNLSLSTHLTHKFSAKDMVVAGIIMDRYRVNFIDSVFRKQSNDYFKLTNTNGNMELYQAYVQWKHKFNNQLLINGGMHFQYFGLNGSTAIEPRAGMEWKVGKGKSLSFGYGLHSQTQPKIIYFVRTELPDGSIEETNRDLGFTQSHQFIAGYQQRIGRNFRFKTEAYYQALQNAPISQSSPNYSVLNEGAYFYITQMDSLINKGRGTNYGLEITFEK